MIAERSLAQDRDPQAIYANNELNLEEIDVYGFDYDYTIAVYKSELNRLIYDMGRGTLINDLKVRSVASFFLYNFGCFYVPWLYLKQASYVIIRM